MIGQKKLQENISRLIIEQDFPRCVLFVGPKGSGRKTIAKDTANTLSELVVEVSDISIASIRTIIDSAYKLKETCVYIIPDIDGMSVAAKNALLKVTEEPPNKAYFIMTIEDINNTLETIKSRATIFDMEPYTPDDIEEYYRSIYKRDDSEVALVKEMCETPGDVIGFVARHPTEFMDYVELVSDNIAEVSGANAFKIPSKVALKENEEGYDLKMFWKLFAKHSFQCALESEGLDKLIYLHRVGITSQYIQSLRVKGINKQMLMDAWILDIRKETLNGAE